MFIILCFLGNATIHSRITWIPPTPVWCTIVHLGYPSACMHQPCMQCMHTPMWALGDPSQSKTHKAHLTPSHTTGQHRLRGPCVCGLDTYPCYVLWCAGHITGKGLVDGEWESVVPVNEVTGHNTMVLSQEVLVSRMEGVRPGSP